MYPVDRKSNEAFPESARPAHFERVDSGVVAQPKVHTHVIVRDVTGATAHLVHQYAPPHSGGDPRPDPVAIGTRSYRPDGNPMVSVFDIIHQQRWSGVHVADHHGKPAIVPQV